MCRTAPHAVSVKVVETTDHGATRATLATMRTRVAVPMLMALFAVPIAVTTAGTATPATAAGGIALLTDVQAQDMGDFDRVTFTFEGGTPTILQADYFDGPALQTRAVSW